MRKRVAEFASEADLCARFIAAATGQIDDFRQPYAVPRKSNWVAYPETGGFDVLLVRRKDGFQIGIEAKLHLNQTVLTQALEGGSWYDPLAPGPDCRAVLVPDGSGREPLSLIAAYCGITIIRCLGADARRGPVFQPYLPHPLADWQADPNWRENLPVRRVVLPDYVPDVAAGSSAPIKLTTWKIGAIRLAILMERRGLITRADFAHLRVDHRRWVGERWVEVDGAKGGWVPGPRWPDFAGQHPKNYAEIAADFEKWAPPGALAQASRGGGAEA